MATIKTPRSVLMFWDYALKFEQRVDANLTIAMIWQESWGRPAAYRFEDRYQYFYDYKRSKPLFQKHLSVDENRLNAYKSLGRNEFYMQSASWGLMQVMGATAREVGFSGEFLSEFCYDPGLAIDYGTNYMKRCMNRSNGDLELALKRYNGSTKYVGEVLAKFQIVKNERFA